MITRRGEFGQEEVPIVQGGRQPVDKNNGRASCRALFYKIDLSRNVKRSAPRQTGIFHIVLPTLCAGLSR